MFIALLLSSALAIGQADSSKAAVVQPPVVSAKGTPTQPETKTLPAEPTTGESYRIYEEGRQGFARRFVKAYVDEFRPKEENGNDQEPARRGLPAPLNSPPFPMTEWQGFPLIGVPKSTTDYPLMKAIYGGSHGDAIKDTGIKAYGWLNGSYNWSTSNNSNTPSSYWVVPNRGVINQGVLRIEREMDTVQQEDMDWGFRSTHMYGIDYRYTYAGGWGERQMTAHNHLYGYDPVEQTFHLYIPHVAQGLILTVGRWVATPDIETQLAPDNYTGTHSLLFTVDVYTVTGIMATVMLNDQWTVQAAIHAGADMAPWYVGAVPTGMFGVRWVSKDNRDSFYTVLNAINNANYRYFELDGQPAGHHNYNIIQTTWQHKFNDCVHTKTEAYYMWEHDAAVGGTASLGGVQFGTGGGIGPTVPGTSQTYGILNYTMFAFSKKDFLTFRNEVMKDENGTRYGAPGVYSSHSVGWTHWFNQNLLVRPEVGYYRNYNNPVFDNGARKDMWMGGLDVILRF